MNIDNSAKGGKVLHVTDDTWQAEVVEASKIMPVFIDFWAEWCQPCKIFDPIVERVAEEMGDRVKFVKLNVDENVNTPQDFGILAIPTLMIFANGEKVVQQSGLLPESAFRQLLEDQVQQMKK